VDLPRLRRTHRPGRRTGPPREGGVISPQLQKVSNGVLNFANRLAIEYHAGTPLRDLPDYRQMELAQEARQRLDRYKEQ
jgi:hypothetical protein